MGEIAKWSTHTFVVSPKLIQGFTNLSIKGGSTTEDKESNGQSYVSRKSGSALQISMTAVLNALTGAGDVKAEAMSFVNEARAGVSDYLYIGAGKVATQRLMLTDAIAEEIVIAPNGIWISCNVKLTFKEAKATGGGGGGGSKKTLVQMIKESAMAGAVAGAAIAFTSNYMGATNAEATTVKPGTFLATVAKAARTADSIVKKANADSKPAAQKTAVKPAKSTKFSTKIAK